MDKRKQSKLLVLVLVGAALLLLVFSSLIGLMLLLRVSKPPEPDFPVGGIVVTGKHVVIHALPVEKANAVYLAALGDTVMETYARYLVVSVPHDPIAIYLLDTAEEYKRADALYDNGSGLNNQGFANEGRVFIHLAPRPGQTVIDNDSMMAHLLAHELCHAFHQRLFSNYLRQPSWLKEGLADAWAERALSKNDSLMAASSPWNGTMLLKLRHAVQKGDTLPIAHILEQPRSTYASSDPMVQYLAYCRSFALVRMLDDPAPANTLRRSQFHAFLKAVNSLEGDDITPQINALFLDLFGRQHLAALQNEFRQRILTEKTCFWEVSGVDVHVTVDGGLLVESGKRTALAFADDKGLSATAHLHARVTVADVGIQQADFLFGKTADNDFYMLSFEPDYIRLFHYQRTYETIGTAHLDTRLFEPGTHTLDVSLHPQRIEARLDGKADVIFVLATGTFPPGQWGIGTYDGRVTFRDVTGKDTRSK